MISGHEIGVGGKNRHGSDASLRAWERRLEAGLLKLL